MPTPIVSILAVRIGAGANSDIKAMEQAAGLMYATAPARHHAWIASTVEIAAGAVLDVPVFPVDALPT
jgi:hypothetical protein